MYDNTPIFDRLSRERGYERLVTDEAPLRLYPVLQATAGPFSRGVRLTKVMQKKEENMPARMTENVHRMDLMDKGVEPREFVGQLVEKFKRRYPDITNVISVTMKEELDGTTTVIVSESDTPLEQTDGDVNAAPNKVIAVKKLSEVQQEEPQNPATKYDNPELYKNVRVIRMHPKLIEDQLSVLNGSDSAPEAETELHMKSPIWGSNEE